LILTSAGGIVGLEIGIEGSLVFSK